MIRYNVQLAIHFLWPWSILRVWMKALVEVVIHSPYIART